MSEAPKVFISYSHDSDAHRGFVRELSNRLRSDGVECLIDQYINGFPPEGWQTWMEDQIEAADYVLMVCTETYLRRYRKKEVDGGKGVTFEGVVVSQYLYDAHYHNAKFIPIIPEYGNYDHVPVPLKAYSAYCLPDQYDDVYRVITGQAQYMPPKLGQLRKLGRKVQVDRLPTVAGEFFGREAELQLLNDALLNHNEHADTRIIQFIAAGGTGKTKLLRHWLNKRENQINSYIIWSFYSQGTSDSKQVSATPLFTEAFKAFGVNTSDYKTDEDRTDALVDLLTEHQCLLVLDGLEPLQHGGSGFNGQMKDRAMKHLLQRLAQQHSSLCIITTRIHVHELSDRAHVISHPLDNLHNDDGRQLLRSLAVQGSDKELQTAVSEVEGHALTLHLLGNALTTYLDSDIRKRDTLEDLVDDFDEQGRHAFKMMQGYRHWFTDDNGEPMAELQLLYLLGLFDHPIETAVLQVLWRAKIRNLTAAPTNFFQRLFDRKPSISKDENKQWLAAIRNLQNKHRLLSQHGKRPDLLDCHPLIREYFGKQLKKNQPKAYKQAHKTLYYYYKELPEDKFPDSVEMMQPLFRAVAHGCAAGFHQQVLNKVYSPRILRGGDNYLSKKLGAFSDDLAVVSNFFSQPWDKPAPGLTNFSQALVLNWAGFYLHALGRLGEAVKPMQASANYVIKKQDWANAASGVSSVSELQLSLGRVTDAITSGESGVGYAKQSRNCFYELSLLSTHANALHQASESAKALTLFVEAEQLQKKRQPEYPMLYSLAGFQYCDLLLGKDGAVEVLKRAEYALDISLNAHKRGIIDMGLSDIALDQLNIGRAHHAQSDLMSSHDILIEAVEHLRESGAQHHLPHGLLARAALYRDLNEYTLAQQDLAEVWEIAEPSGMRLFMTDYHLEMARLLLKNPMLSPAEEKTLSLADHTNAAETLINATGYHRRDDELAALKNEITSTTEP